MLVSNLKVCDCRQILTTPIAAQISGIRASTFPFLCMRPDFLVVSPTKYISDQIFEEMSLRF